MNLEIGIETLLRKQRVESDRIEFKRGWNPDDIYMSICAFANDFDNVGGGYIVIGVEEKNGMAVRPVRGVDESELDGIQKDMVGFNHKIQPTYAAKVAIEKADGKTLVVLWVPTGMQRPYKTTEHVTSKKDNHYKYVIRYNSSSVVANPEQERELLAMTSWQAFDEQGNTEATLDDISPILLMEHLRVTGSRLAGQVTDRGVKEILEEMELLTGPPERQLLKNVALMMFCENPRKFFPDTQVEIVKFPRGAIKDPNNFIEVPPIRGSVPQIISRTMTTIKDMAIAERVEKVNYKMEANRYLSYPYAALEEVIVNAFYHRDYMCHQPVHVEIEPEFITVISYPGIDRSIPDEVIRKGERFRSRYYRNRRLGSFLKELDLCEGHCTAIPTIQEELKKIGSPRATFETDEFRRALTVEIPIQPDFYRLTNELGDGEKENFRQNGGSLAEVLAEVLAEDDYTRFLPVINYLDKNDSITTKQAVNVLNKSERSAVRYLRKLVSTGYVIRKGETNNIEYIKNV